MATVGIIQVRKAVEAAFPGVEFKITRSNNRYLKGIEVAWLGGPSAIDVEAATPALAYNWRNPQRVALSREMTPAERAVYFAEKDVINAALRAKYEADAPLRAAQATANRKAGAVKAAATRAANALYASQAPVRDAERAARLALLSRAAALEEMSRADAAKVVSKRMSKCTRSLSGLRVAKGYKGFKGAAQGSLALAGSRCLPSALMAAQVAIARTSES